MARTSTPLAVARSLVLALAAVLAACGAESPLAGRLLASGADDRDPRLTPGHLCTQADPDFDGLRYAERIAHCRRRVTAAQKRAVGATYGLDPSQFGDYQFDHFYPLSIGGSNDSRNIWPLVYAEARRKAAFEQQLYNRISRGEITQRQAIAAIEAWR